MAHTGTHLDRRYIGILCVISLLILFAGVWFRPSSTPPPVPSELETMRVQLARQRLDLERRSLFFAQKAADLLKVAADSRVHPDSVPYRLSAPGETILLVGPDSNGQPLWAATQTAGVTTSLCAGSEVEEIATTIRIPATLSNAVAFDFDNNLSGFVLDCGTGLLLSTPAGFQAWTARRALEQSLDGCCGLRVDASLAVTAIDPESVLAKRGLRAGDVILAVGGQPVSSRAALRDALANTEAPPSEVTFRRDERSRRLILPKVAPAR